MMISFMILIPIKYYYGNNIKQNESGEAFCTLGRKRNTCRFLSVNREVERPFGRSGHRWNVSIKMYYNGITL
jgi:hypothetical protein